MHYDHNLHRCCGPPKEPDSFTRFQRLPAELRTMIWEYSLPEPRVYEVLDAPNANQKTPAQKGLMFANVHPEPPPALAAVCRESRYFVLHHYKPLTLGQTTKFVDLSRDILLLEPYLLVKRLHRTLHFMSQIPLLRDNINRLALGTSYGIYTGICHPVLSWKVSKTNMSKLLASLAKFEKLKALVFIVHQEFQFEFDFRFPGTMTPIPRNAPPQPPPQPTLVAPAPAPAPPSSYLAVPPPSGLTGYPLSQQQQQPMNRPAPAIIPRPMGTINDSSSVMIPSPSQAPPQPAQRTIPPQPTAQLQQLDGRLPPSSSSSAAAAAHHRPQLVHQAYRFKFDIEANINHAPVRKPHLNEFLYYPLDIDEDKDDWDLGELADDDDGNGGGGEWCDPWPTNDDWRRFRKRFQRAITLSLEQNSSSFTTEEGSLGESGGGAWRKAGGSGGGSGYCPVRELHGRLPLMSNGGAWGSNGGAGGDRERIASEKAAASFSAKKVRVPAIKGASLLWRYTRGGYV
ncbi:hypothetical protein B0H66DRAFT_37739 [Apodospora peruviana]|uniref:2EXR domain-containing protein n=1 Tax=Apodospora peruviana TaxID=516989 RepID=A0AAE0IRM8_9PEZI|nr:hypothetical protein B0H66DRAFT_37739 [Apodospora peruviana]